MSTLVPIEFAIKKTSIDWCDLKWGYAEGYVSWRKIVSLAEKKSGDEPLEEEVLDLARVNNECVWKVAEQLEILTERTDCRPEVSKQKWLYTVLSWLFENRAELPDPLGAVEDIYADFDYPEEIRSFVRYMPPVGQRDPRLYSLEENNEALLSNWREYLSSSGFNRSNMSLSNK